MLCNCYFKVMFNEVKVSLLMVHELKRITETTSQEGSELLLMNNHIFIHINQ